MYRTYSAPRSLCLCRSDLIDNLLQNFTDANKRLDAVQKNLSGYLEEKRLAFGRFFFLSHHQAPRRMPL